MKTAAVDDLPTLAALGVLAFALTNMSHEAVGHGLATLAVGGKAILLTTCYFTSSGSYSKWIPAAGGLTNLAVGLVSLGVLRLFQRLGARLRYFLVLVAAFNLFFAFGYPAYSGITRFGDWAAVISGLEPSWVWRVLLVVVAVAGYYGSMKLLARAIAPFAAIAGVAKGGPPALARLRRITLVPYVASIILACLAGAMNPKGLVTMLTAGLPAAAAAFGLTQMDQLVWSGWSGASEEVIEPLQRSFPCIMAAVFVLTFFVAVLGPGIRFSQ
jgi:hypothetical protein